MKHFEIIEDQQICRDLAFASVLFDINKRFDHGALPFLQPECVISQLLRFTTQMQYVNKMYRRWGPNVRKMECIRRHVEANDGKMDQIPLVRNPETSGVCLLRAKDNTETALMTICRHI